MASTCAWCGGSIPPDRAPQAKYCGVECRDRRGVASKRGTRRPPQKHFVCVVCAGRIPSTRHRACTTCSEECTTERRRELGNETRRAKTQRKLAGLTKTCAHCQQVFTPQSMPWQQYCSKRCAQQAGGKRAELKRQERLSTGDFKQCTVEDCGGLVVARGYCRTHYARWHKHGDPLHRAAPRQTRCCDVKDCPKAAAAFGLCPRHRRLQKLYGDALGAKCTQCRIRYTASGRPGWCVNCVAEVFANNGYRVLEAFQGSSRPVKVACLSCGEASAVLFSNVIRGGSCVHCFRRLRAGRDRALPKSEALRALTSLRLVLAGPYARATLAVAAECLDCGTGTTVKISDITRGQRLIGCRNCARDAAANEITYCAAGCGRSFGQPLGGPRRKWCSQTCMEYFGQYSKPHPKNVGTRHCLDCETDITAKQLSAVRCDACLPAWRNEARRRLWAENPELRRRQQADAANRRRARIRGNGRERYERLDVFERDRWRCRLCSFPVDQTAQWPDPLSAAIDHVVPIAAGGADTLSNVQLTHQGCNWRKWSKDSIGIGPDEFIHPAVAARFLAGEGTRRSEGSAASTSTAEKPDLRRGRAPLPSPVQQSPRAPGAS